MPTFAHGLLWGTSLAAFVNRSVCFELGSFLVCFYGFDLEPVFVLVVQTSIDVIVL